MQKIFDNSNLLNNNVGLINSHLSTVIEGSEQQSCRLSAGTSFRHINVADASGNCGKNTKPWIIEASLGKTIQVELYNFKNDPKAPGSTPRSGEVQPSTCLRIGTLTDTSSKQEIPVCADGKRFKSLLKSRGSSVEILFSHGDLSFSKSYLLRFRGYWYFPY